jgi:uncharacterized repeat protein (TIGR03803 family)
MNATAVSILQGSRLAVVRLIAGSAAFVVAAGFAQAQSPTASVPAAKVPTETVLYNFAGGADGIQPIAGLIFGSKGALYGTTQQGGGTSNAGTVFKLTPPARSGMPWAETVLHSFTGQPDGNGPWGPLIFLDTSGALYGTTLAGGPWDQGMVFKLMPPAGGGAPWTKTVLYSFGNPAVPSDGLNPAAGAGLILTPTARSTAQRGAEDWATVFKLTPPAKNGMPWTETVLYRFPGGSDSNNPRSGVIFDTRGALYGTTAGVFGAGNGTVFKLTLPAGGGTPWTETVLHNFSGPPDGSNPVAGLIFDSDGALYGTTPNGGVAAGGGYGTVFKLTPPDKKQNLWTETVLYRFTGGGPNAGLIFDKKGALYGTTAGGGTAGAGTVFQLTGTKH